MPEKFSASERCPLSVLVITLNEEMNIAACLESVRWAAEVFVVDSLSSDRTVEIAGNFGAKVYLHPFEGYAKQRNWALDNLPFSHEWVLMLDADEQIPPPLAEEIGRILNRDGEGCAGFYLSRRFFFLGRWLKHGGLYPTWLLRLFKRQAVRVEERPMNEHVVLNGVAGHFKEPFEHRDSRPLSDWIAKHNRYADLGAEEYIRERYEAGYAGAITPRLWGTQPERKRWIKLRIWNRLPLLTRPTLFFFRNYVLRAGFLDAKPGFIYHVLWSYWYPFLIGANVIERQRRQGKFGLAAAAVSEGAERELSATEETDPARLR